MSKPSQTSEVRLLPLAEVGKRIGYRCVRSVKRAIDRGELPPPVPFGGQLCIVEAELDACLAKKLADRERQVQAMRLRRAGALDRFRVQQQNPQPS